MIQITGDISKLENLRIKLVSISKFSISPYKKPLLALAQQQTDSNFAGQEDSEGNKWPRLKASTIKQKERKGFSSEALVKTGALKAARLQSNEAGQNTLLTNYTDSKIARIASYQQLGTKRIPVRSYIARGVKFSEGAKDIIAKGEMERISNILSG